MNVVLPEQYIVHKFYQYAGNAHYSRSTNSYRGGCPSCHEGKSWGRKTRLFFVAREKYLYCHNCQKSWTPMAWLKEVSGMSFKEIMKESMQYDYGNVIQEEEVPVVKEISTKLPFNVINLEDPVQLHYFKDNAVVKKALDVIKTRRLDTAINRSSAYYLSLEDFVHKNRLCIPFYDRDNRILFYQTRALFQEDAEKAKYLSKINTDKRVFGLNKLDEALEYIFIFEGPIDAMFVKNGVSMAGLQITKTQSELLDKFILHKRIWILDNQPENEEVCAKNLELLERGETIFIWPDNYKQFKDLNELCCKMGVDYVNPEFFIKNTYSGLKGKVMLKLHMLNL